MSTDSSDLLTDSWVWRLNTEL